MHAINNATGRGIAGIALGCLLALAGCKEDLKLKVTGLEPTQGNYTGGTYVKILGNRFTKDITRNVKVYFGDRQAQVNGFRSDTELVVIAPGGEIGKAVDVLVVFDPGGEIRVPKAFTFIERNGATIDDIGIKPSTKPATK